MIQPNEELRRHPRVHVDVEVKVHTAEGKLLTARTRDLSRSGICLVTGQALQTREQLRIELVLVLGPNTTSEPLPLRSRVVWCTPIAGAFQIGAMFDGLSSKESSFLDMFMRYLDGSILPAGAEMESLSIDEEPATNEQGVGEASAREGEDKDDPFRR
jgi:hypothetical protein